MKNNRIEDNNYLTPNELSVTPVCLNRIITIGSCLLRGWLDVIERAQPNCKCEYYLTNNETKLPSNPVLEISKYDFQIIQLSLRSILPDREYFRLQFKNYKSYEKLFYRCQTRITDNLYRVMRWNREHGILTFVFNLIVPQANPMGRLLPRYDLRNMRHFIEKLNEHLSKELEAYNNSYIFDIDQLLSVYGKKYYSDDAVWQINHASALKDLKLEHNWQRFEKVKSIGTYYTLHLSEIQEIGWNEIVAMYKTVQQLDIVKLVVVDIDDTLWRGIAADDRNFSSENVEGWPLGIVETLGYLKRRGVLLAILSKNDEHRVSEVWEKTIYSRRLSFEDFAIRKINWQPKVENLKEILLETNLLPQSTLVIDDNPLERNAIKAAYPEIRVFGENPYLWRRILLWSAETQVSSITRESEIRTKTVQSKIINNKSLKGRNHRSFLANINLSVTLNYIDDINHPRFPRVIELINKTNQFNTTGKRWSNEECQSTFKNGTKFWTFNVNDLSIDYGIVGIVVQKKQNILQFAMSCRVIGLDVEIAVLNKLTNYLQNKGYQYVSVNFKKTKSNLLCQKFLMRCGFVKIKEGYKLKVKKILSIPEHITVINNGKLNT